MPFYEYRCEDCGHELEALQKISDAPLKTCPACGTDALKKLVSASAFVLKGSGWYVTDFRDKQPKGKSDKAAEKPGDKPAADAKSGEAAAKSDRGEKKSGEKTTSTSKDTGPAKKAANE